MGGRASNQWGQRQVVAMNACRLGQMYYYSTYVQREGYVEQSIVHRNSCQKKYYTLILIIHVY